MRGGEVYYDSYRREWRARLDYDAEDLRALADAWGPSDAAYAECMELANDLDERNAPDPGAPGFRIGVYCR